MCPVEIGKGTALPSCLSFHTVKKFPFCSLFTATSLAFLCFLLVTLLVKIPLSVALKVLPDVPWCKKAIMCHTEKICEWEKLHVGTRYGVLAMSLVFMKQQYILNKVPLDRNTPKTRLYSYIDQLVQIFWKCCLQEPNPVLPLRAMAQNSWQLCRTELLQIIRIECIILF